ncbi:hypothetical protein [Salinimicrobium terrae]|uniref:hypothetical protein n=1 Tax=Salinimicrobium terrae TaxID=470866 RepID=UPI0004018697|nr:hypothetical protein [Salinimicrobium terrae]
MKKFLYLKGLAFLPVYLVLLLLMGCQEEEYEVLTEEEEQSLSRDSETFDLVMRTAMHDGSLDDEIDNSPCFSLITPYEIVVNGVKITINSNSDLEEFIKNRGAGNNSGKIELQFPLTATNSNYQQIPINNPQQLRALQQRCQNEVALGEQPVTCAEIEFPVTVFLYDKQLQKTFSENISNKESFFQFLSNVRNGQVFNFFFPLQVEVDGALISVDNNKELRNLLRKCNN